VPADTPFTRRIEQLLKDTGLSKSRLGIEADLSPYTIALWLKESRAGKPFGTRGNLEKLAKRYNKSVEWLLSDPDADDNGAAKPGVLSLSQGDNVIGALVELDGVPVDEAQRLVREVHRSANTELGLYRRARLELGRKLLRPHQATPPVGFREKGSKLGRAIAKDSDDLLERKPPRRARNAGKKRQ